MSRIHLLAGLLLLSVAAGCKAQPSPQGSPDAALSRQIEVMVRSKFGVPQDFDLAFGARKPSQVGRI